VIFNGLVGADVIGRNFNNVWLDPSYMNSLYSLTVYAETTVILADIVTFETQNYFSNILVGDNGTNGMTRTLVSEDPMIQIKPLNNIDPNAKAKIDDIDPAGGQHSLVLKAIALTRNQTPVIDLEIVSGSIAKLNRFETFTGQQSVDNAAIVTAIALNNEDKLGGILINGSIDTVGGQYHTARSISGQATFSSQLGVDQVVFDQYTAPGSPPNQTPTGFTKVPYVPPTPVGPTTPSGSGRANESAFIMASLNRAIDGEKSNIVRTGKAVVSVGEALQSKDGALLEINPDQICDLNKVKECPIK
jgi:hypothetical protein